MFNKNITILYDFMFNIIYVFVLFVIYMPLIFSRQNYQTNNC